MALKYLIDDLVQVPEPDRSLYKPTPDGKFVLTIDGLPDTSKVNEFRARNIELMKATDVLKATVAKFEGIDPDAAKAALANLAKFEGVDPDEYHTLKARPDATARAAELEASLAAEKAAHAATQLRHAVTAEFLKCGGRSSAIDFTAEAAAKVFAMKDGELTTTEFSASNPSEKLSLAEWMTQRAKEADFTFLPSHGGGAGGRTASPVRFGASSNQKILKDPTPQQLGEHASAIARGEVKIEYS